MEITFWDFTIIQPGISVYSINRTLRNEYKSFSKSLQEKGS